MKRMLTIGVVMTAWCAMAAYYGSDKYNGFYYRAHSDGLYISGYNVSYPVANVTIPSYISNAKYANKNVVGVEDGALSDLNNIENLTIPLSIRTIGANAFTGGKSFLKTLTFVTPENITNIGDHAFANCKLLTSFNISSNLVYLGIGALRGCTFVDNLRGR